MTIDAMQYKLIFVQCKWKTRTRVRKHKTGPESKSSPLAYKSHIFWQRKIVNLVK